MKVVYFFLFTNVVVNHLCLFYFVMYTYEYKSLQQIEEGYSYGVLFVQNASSGIPPPARFASGSCTLPRGNSLAGGTTLAGSGAVIGEARCGIPLQHLRTLPRPGAPAPAPRLPPRDTPL